MKLLKFILPAIFIFYSCSSDSNETNNIVNENTKLELTILDENNIAIENAEVKLYASENDYWDDTNIIGTLFTSSNGKVTFQNLQPTTYYWKILSNCRLNNDLNNSENSLTLNGLNPFIIHLTNNNFGNIDVTNDNGFVNYNVSYTGPESGTFTVNANTTFNLEHIDTGDYVFEFTATNGSAPTVQYPITLNCGDSSTITVQ